MFSFLFEKALTDEEQVQFIAAVREKVDVSQDKFADAHVRRFCVGSEWDETATVEQLRKHLKWREETLPIERTPAVDRVINSGRITVLRRGKEPIFLVDFMWGRFLLDDFKETDIYKAQILLAEEMLAEADALCPEDEPAQWIAISTGGPPPSGYVGNNIATFVVNYPERCIRAIIYPIPKWLQYVADVILKMAPKRTRAKFVMLSDESELLEKTGLAAADLPESLQGGLTGAYERRDKAKDDALEQLPQVFMDALTKADHDVQVMMTQAAC
jgi:hypothetical protein